MAHDASAGLYEAFAAVFFISLFIGFFLCCLCCGDCDVPPTQRRRRPTVALPPVEIATYIVELPNNEFAVTVYNQ